ncbi:MAG: tRNA threonylcarbamoyladenosine dehydratase [Firmicutes bacterium]|jgi:tRNA A37 threonylcarbamoyladenosine dehydratase|nr:tRNA threonylcarbamoyladenosine dehydratase [Bacillota bacterium]
MSTHPFNRTELLIGPEGLAILAQSRVVICGLGGVGSYAAEALARAGIGSLVLVDHDIISATNINRQIHALTTTVGQPKVQVMAHRLRKINPRLNLTLWQEFFTAKEAEFIFASPVDYVVDAIDTVSAKVDLILTARQRELPIVSCMGMGNKLDPTCLQVTDISKTHTCPLAKAVRRLLRQAGVSQGVKVVFSTEQPLRVHGGTPGSISYVPPVAGFFLAACVVRDLLGID